MIKRTYTKRSLDKSFQDEPSKRRRVEEPTTNLASSSPSRASAQIFSDDNMLDDDWTPPSSPNLAVSKAIVAKYAAMTEQETRREATKQRPMTYANENIKPQPWERGTSPRVQKSALIIKKSRSPLSKKSSKIIKTVKAKGLTQMRLDLGQTIHKRCQDCGMEYRPSVAEDKKLHDKYHSQLADGIPLPPKLGPQLRIMEDEEAGLYKEDIIIPIDMGKSTSKANNKLVRTALEVVEKELGGVGIKDEELWSQIQDTENPLIKHDKYKTLLWVHKDRILGVCLAERISKAFPVMSTTVESAITISTQAEPATMGISRIWVSKCARGQGIADKLLRFAAKRFIYRVNIPRERIAFSQPTTMGTKLARRFFGKDAGWLVYNG